MITAYQWSAQRNWGDRLTVHLLRHWSRIPATGHPVAEESDILGVGSVAGHVSSRWGGAVLGAGCLTPADRVSPCADIWGLRGRLTLERSRPTMSRIVLGDPGLIADELVRLPVRTHRLGVLPHWSDTELVKRREFWRFDPVFIDPAAGELEVIRQIGSCEKLVTSSLHGMILADAFAIPRRFETARKLGFEGGTFKHEDYSSAIGHPFEVGKTSSPNRFRVNDVRDRLIDMYEAYGEAVRDGVV